MIQMCFKYPLKNTGVLCITFFKIIYRLLTCLSEKKVFFSFFLFLFFLVIKLVMQSSCVSFSTNEFPRTLSNEMKSNVVRFLSIHLHLKCDWKVQDVDTIEMSLFKVQLLKPFIMSNYSHWIVIQTYFKFNNLRNIQGRQKLLIFVC